MFLSIPAVISAPQGIHKFNFGSFSKCLLPFSLTCRFVRGEAIKNKVSQILSRFCHGRLLKVLLKAGMARPVATPPDNFRSQKSKVTSRKSVAQISRPSTFDFRPMTNNVYKFTKEGIIGLPSEKQLERKSSCVTRQIYT